LSDRLGLANVFGNKLQHRPRAGRRIFHLHPAGAVVGKRYPVRTRGSV